MLNKENLEKSANLRRGENREFWEEFDKTLQKQRECYFVYKNRIVFSESSFNKNNKTVNNKAF